MNLSKYFQSLRHHTAMAWGWVAPMWPRLLLAYGCMLLYALSSATYAFISGPALRFIFTGIQPLGQSKLASSGADAGALEQAPKLLESILPEAWRAMAQSELTHFGIWLLPGVIVAAATLKGLAQAGQFFWMGKVAQETVFRLRQKTFAQLLEQDLDFHRQNSRGSLLSRLTHDVIQVEHAVFYGLGPLLRDTLAVVALLASCVLIDPKLALWTLLTVPLAAVPLAHFAKRLKRVSSMGQAEHAEVMAHCSEKLEGIAEVQAFGSQSQALEDLRQAGIRFRFAMLKSYAIRAIRTPTMEWIGAWALAAWVAYLGHRVQSGALQPERLVSFLTATLLLYDPLKKLGRVADHLSAGAAAHERIFEIQNRQPAVSSKPQSQAPKPPPFDIELANIGFCYDARDTGGAALHDLSLTLKPGQQIALVGPSGGGKSTLAALLARFIDPQSGTLWVGGDDLRDLDLAAWRRNIAWVGQEAFLFSGSICENLKLGTGPGTPIPSPSDAQIQEALHAAQALEFIEKLPQGLNTPVGNRGALLSGGQRQRICLARALLRPAALRILDEATSQLDAHQEHAVVMALKNWRPEQISLVIAHRLSTIRNADQIVFIEDGRITAMGSHVHLLAQRGTYAQMVAYQAEGAT